MFSHRASIMTGKYPARLHLTDYIPGRSSKNSKLITPDWKKELPLGEVTIAEVLKDAGYATGHFGKWHIGREKPYRPENRGFHESYGIEGGGTPKLSPRIYHNGVRQEQKDGYATDMFFEKAFAWIDEKEKKRLLSLPISPRTILTAPLAGSIVCPVTTTKSIWASIRQSTKTPRRFIGWSRISIAMSARCSANLRNGRLRRTRF